jgi:hypothetical protein
VAHPVIIGLPGARFSRNDKRVSRCGPRHRIALEIVF